MLEQILQDTQQRQSIIADCVKLVDSEVQSKSGLSGMAVKGAYGLVKKVKPGIIRDAVDKLLNDFVTKLEPYFARFQEQDSGDFADFLSQRKPEVASSLLEVTDAKISGANNKTIKKAYEKLRPTGQKHVESAVPGVGSIIQKYAASL